MIKFKYKTFYVDTEKEAAYVNEALDNITPMWQDYFSKMPYVDFSKCFNIKYNEKANKE